MTCCIQGTTQHSTSQYTNHRMSENRATRGGICANGTKCCWRRHIPLLRQVQTVRWQYAGALRHSGDSVHTVQVAAAQTSAVSCARQEVTEVRGMFSLNMHGMPYVQNTYIVGCCGLETSHPTAAKTAGHHLVVVMAVGAGVEAGAGARSARE